MMRIKRKQTLRSLSLSYQKKDGRTWSRRPFFWYDTDFSGFDSADIIDYILEKSVSYQKKDGREKPDFQITRLMPNLRNVWYLIFKLPD